MASFTRDWDETSPLGSADANTIDDIIRNNEVDLSDRLKSLIYGFIAGENDGKPGIKNAIFKQQASAPSTPNPDEISLYALDDGSNCGLMAKNEDGYTKQILKKVGGDLLFDVTDEVDDSSIEVSSGKLQIKAGGVTSAMLEGTLPDGADLAAATESGDSDRTIADKAYVDAKEDIISTQATAGIFGARTDKDSGGSDDLVINQVYKAECDGFITFCHQQGNQGLLYFYTDSNSTPTTEIGINHGDWGNGYWMNCVPIKKDDYWTITYAGAGTGLEVV